MTRSKPLILNIDDDEPGRYAVGRTLLRAGYQVTDAETGEGGFQLARSEKPDLILLDIRLPDIDGYEVCRRIRALPEIADTPVVHMSASFVDTASLVKGLDSGADAYLTEPTDPAVLVATVNSMLRMKRAEQTVIRAAQRWQNTFEAICDGVALLGEDGSTLQSNRLFRGMVGLDHAIAKAFQELQGGARRTVKEARLADKVFEITLDPTFNGGRGLAGAVCIVSDITEKKKFDEQMRQTARLESLGVLAGGIAHDFNNLLTVILGNSSLMLDSMPEDSKDRELVEQIVQASSSAADLTKQILAYSGKGRFVMKGVDLGATAAEVRSFVRRMIPATVELSIDTQPNLPLVLGDEGQMQQLLMNLTINAAESIPADLGGIVRVTIDTQYVEEDFFHVGEAVAPGEYVLLAVSDTGSGMTAETQERIFDPFFTTKFTGRGLGLSAALGIVQGHQGMLRLQSKLGEGTTFRLYLPVADQQLAELPTQVHPVQQEKRSGTILVVDDESGVRRFLQLALEKLGYTVLLAENGQQTVDTFRKRSQEIDMIILDFTMPGMNGEDALNGLFAIRADVPVVLSSGFSQAAAAKRFHGKGLAGFLNKPYTSRVLAEVVGSVLAGRAHGELHEL